MKIVFSAQIALRQHPAAQSDEDGSGFSPEEIAFRGEVRAFIAENGLTFNSTRIHGRGRRVL